MENLNAKIVCPKKLIAYRLLDDYRGDLTVQMELWHNSKQTIITFRNKTKIYETLSFTNQGQAYDIFFAY